MSYALKISGGTVQRAGASLASVKSGPAFRFICQTTSAFVIREQGVNRRAPTNHSCATRRVSGDRLGDVVYASPVPRLTRDAPLGLRAGLVQCGPCGAGERRLRAHICDTAAAPADGGAGQTLLAGRRLPITEVVATAAGGALYALAEILERHAHARHSTRWLPRPTRRQAARDHDAPRAGDLRSVGPHVVGRGSGGPRSRRVPRAEDGPLRRRPAGRSADCRPPRTGACAATTVHRHPEPCA